MNIECPKCKEAFNGELVAEVPANQVLHITLTSESEMFAAATIGKAINSMDEILRGIAHNLGSDVCVFLKSVDYKPREIKTGFPITAINTRA